MSESFNILNRAKQNLQSRGITRPDLAFTDFVKVEPGRARIAVAYTGSVPSMQEVVAFVGRTFQGKVVPKVETLRNYEGNKVVSCIVTVPCFTRPLDNKQGMVQVTASTFMDVTDESTWSIESNATTGAKYLSRAIDEDIDAILEAKRERMGSRHHVTASTTLAMVTAGYLDANENDYVEFYSGTLKYGVIKSVTSAGKLKILDDEGETFVVDRADVVQIVRKDPEEQEKIDQNLKDFYTSIYGEDYTKELFKNGSKV